MDGEASGAASRRRGEGRLPRSLVPFLIIAGVAQLCILGLIGWTISAERHARLVTRGETNTLLAVNQLIEGALDAETGQRGYLLTGRPIYLQPYLAAKQQIAQSENQLSSLLSEPDARELQPHFAAIQRNISQKIAELDRTIALFKGGKREAAIALVNTDRGRQLMDAIRSESRLLTDGAAARRQELFERTAAIEKWSLLLVVLLGLGSAILGAIGLRSEARQARYAAEAEQAAALREANERAHLLTRELNHRVKNLFAIVMAIISLSGRRRPESAGVVADIRSRIHALALAHEVSQGQVRGEEVMLDALLRQIVTPYVGTGEERVHLSGPPLALKPRMITPFGLIFHELATNAAKYGALSADGGQVNVEWEVLPVGDSEGELHLRWIETGGPALSVESGSAGEPGFGSRMITLAVQQLEGRIEQQWPEDGAFVQLVCPWK
jgi:two-component sensor histidine kinase/CHASE3 domain sensor protein